MQYFTPVKFSAKVYLVNLHPPLKGGPPFPPFNPPIFKGGRVIGLTNRPLKRVVTSTLKGGPPLLWVDHPLKGGCIRMVD